MQIPLLDESLREFIFCAQVACEWSFPYEMEVASVTSSIGTLLRRLDIKVTFIFYHGSDIPRRRKDTTTESDRCASTLRTSNRPPKVGQGNTEDCSFHYILSECTHHNGYLLRSRIKEVELMWMSYIALHIVCNGESQYRWGMAYSNQMVP
jgi:hypothetical protein